MITPIFPVISERALRGNACSSGQQHIPAPNRFEAGGVIGLKLPTGSLRTNIEFGVLWVSLWQGTYASGGTIGASVQIR